MKSLVEKMIKKPHLLVAKGNINRMGGAERDLIRCLPHLQQWYDVSVATLNPSTKLSNLCQEKNIKIFLCGNLDNLLFMY